jgi:hypothetical protein
LSIVPQTRPCLFRLLTEAAIFHEKPEGEERCVEGNRALLLDERLRGGACHREGPGSGFARHHLDNKQKAKDGLFC